MKNRHREERYHMQQNEDEKNTKSTETLENETVHVQIYIDKVNTNNEAPKKKQFITERYEN
mgnify:CR=1 FL=1